MGQSKAKATASSPLQIDAESEKEETPSGFGCPDAPDPVHQDCNYFGGTLDQLRRFAYSILRPLLCLLRVHNIIIVALQRKVRARLRLVLRYPTRTPILKPP